MAYRLGSVVLTMLLMAGAAQGAMISHWALDEGSGQAVSDSAGTNHGTLGTNATVESEEPTWNSAANSYFGSSSLSFVNATNDKVFVPDSNSLKVGTGDLSVSAWFRVPTTSESWGYVIAKGGGTDSGDKGFGLGLETRNSRTRGLYGFIHDGGRQMFSNVPATIDDGQWHHVTAVWDRSGTGKWLVYLDGVEPLVSSSETITRTGSIDAGNTLGLGSMPTYDNINSGSMDGDLDDVSLWSEALTPGKALAIGSLGLDPTLRYTAGQTERLFDVYDGLATEAVIGSRTWRPAGGLTGSRGDLLDLGGGEYALVLDNSGGGVTTIPEPATLAILSAGGIALLRRRRNA